MMKADSKSKAILGTPGDSLESGHLELYIYIFAPIDICVCSSDLWWIICYELFFFFFFFLTMLSVRIPFVYFFPRIVFVQTETIKQLCYDYLHTHTHIAHTNTQQGYVEAGWSRMGLETANIYDLIWLMHLTCEGMRMRNDNSTAMSPIGSRYHFCHCLRHMETG